MLLRLPYNNSVKNRKVLLYKWGKSNLFLASHTTRNEGKVKCISVAIFVRLLAV